MRRPQRPPAGTQAWHSPLPPLPALACVAGKQNTAAEVQAHPSETGSEKTLRCLLGPLLSLGGAARAALGQETKASRQQVQQGAWKQVLLPDHVPGGGRPGWL